MSAPRTKVIPHNTLQPFYLKWGVSLNVWVFLLKLTRLLSCLMGSRLCPALNLRGPGGHRVRALLTPCAEMKDSPRRCIRILCLIIRAVDGNPKCVMVGPGPTQRLQSRGGDLPEC